MKLRSRQHWLPTLLPLLVLPYGALASPLETGRDYISLQIASGGRQALEKHYQKNAGLPYLRIEQRGNLYVLRAGYWRDLQEAHNALNGQPQENGLLRSAAFRPDNIVRRNWDDAMVATPAQTNTNDAARHEPNAPEKNTPHQHQSAIQPIPAPPYPQPSPAQTGTVTPTPSNDTRNKLLRKQSPFKDENTDRGTENQVSDTLRPFNQEDYALAYAALLASGNQQEAFRIAHKAVASVPGNVEWRRKLAQLAEWTQHPTIAWENWKYLFDHGDRSDAVLKAMLRLSSLAENPEIELTIWHALDQRKPLTSAELTELANTYEEAAKPQEGSLFFEKRYRQHGDSTLLEHAARLAEHSGNDERAIQLYTERNKLKPFSLTFILSNALLLIRKDRTREAYNLLQAHRNEVPVDAADYWRILSNTAWELNELVSAEEPLRHYITTKNTNINDWSRLVFLVRQHHPEQAADLAFDVYQRFGNHDYLLLALSLYAGRGNTNAQRRILTALTKEQQTALQASPAFSQFLVLRAQYHQANRAPDRAWTDLSTALKLDGQNVETNAAALWFLIDTQRMNNLRELLVRLAPQAEKEAAYWLPFAAAHHALDRYREATYWYRKEIRRKPDDMLLLLNYADALERLQQAGMAERIRRHAWIQLRTRYPKADLTTPLDDKPDLLALARLALQNQPGDPGLELVRKIANRLRGLAEETRDEKNGTPSNDQQTNDLILSWSINQETFLNARSWLWLRYARQQANQSNHPATQKLSPTRNLAPLWGASQTALQLNDTETMAYLLDRNAERLPIYNRYDIAYALEHWPQALNIGFRGLEANDVDEELYDRYRIHAPQHTNYLQFTTSKDRLGPLNSHASAIDARLVADRKLHVLLGWSSLAQTSDDRTLFPLLDHAKSESLSNLGLRWFDQRSTTEFTLFHRNELSSNTGWRLQHNWTESQRLSLDTELTHHAASNESIPLRVAGQEDALRLTLGYSLGKREDIRITPRWAVYRSQFGEVLGHGKSLELEAGYRFRTEYPDWRARVFLNRQLLTADGHPSAETIAQLSPTVQTEIASGALNAASYFIPESNSSAGLCLSMGENIAGQSLRETYSRAWRPFMDACRTTSQLNGAGYSALFGAAGSVTGEDHLRVQVEQNMGGSSSAGAPASGSLTRQFSMRYRHYF